MEQEAQGRSVNIVNGASDKHNDQKTAGQATGGRQRHQKYHLLKRHADLADKVFAGVGVLSGAFSATAFNFHANIPGAMLLADVVLCVIGALYFHISIYLGKRRLVVGSWPVGAVAAAIFCLSVASVALVLNPVFWPPKPATPPKPFSVIPGWEAYAPTDGNTGLSDFISFGQYGPSLALRPINLLTYVTLANNRDLPTNIVGISAEENGWGNEKVKWSRLCYVPLVGQKLLYIGMGRICNRA